MIVTFINRYALIYMQKSPNITKAVDLNSLRMFVHVLAVLEALIDVSFFLWASYGLS